MTAQLFPFGKLKGRPVNGYTVQEEQRYVLWLLSQRFVAEKYPALHHALRVEMAALLNKQLAEELV